MAPVLDLWMVVLAGGDGERLRPLVRALHGDDRPKQFARPSGDWTMLDRTLSRMAPLVPPERTIVVTQRTHHEYLPPSLTDGRRAQVFAQPGNRGTGLASLLPVRWIAQADPSAQVLIVPCDHHVSDDERLRSHIRGVARRRLERIVLMGARPTIAEREYGWIERGAPLDARAGLYEVQGFLEKPAPDVAHRCLLRGDLWNTLLLLAPAARLVEQVVSAVPMLRTQLRAFPAGPWDDDRLERWYGRLAPVDLSRDVLQVTGKDLLVSRLPEIAWTDLGTVSRVLEWLDVRGDDRPPEFRALTARARLTPVMASTPEPWDSAEQAVPDSTTVPTVVA